MAPARPEEVDVADAGLAEMEGDDGPGEVDHQAVQELWTRLRDARAGRPAATTVCSQRKPDGRSRCFLGVELASATEWEHGSSKPEVTAAGARVVIALQVPRRASCRYDADNSQLLHVTDDDVYVCELPARSGVCVYKCVCPRLLRLRPYGTSLNTQQSS